MMILADLFLSVIGVMTLLIASITDIRTKEVPDWLSFAAIAAALGIRLTHAIAYADYYYFIYGIVGFGIMFFLGLILYYGRLWGGGDTKLLMGLGALFGTAPFFVKVDYPFIAVLLVNIIVVGSIYSLLFAIKMFVRNYRPTIIELKRQMERMRFARFCYLGGSLVFLLAFFFFEDKFLKVIAISFAGFSVFYIHLLIFIRAVEKVGMFKVIPIAKLTEGDWIAEDIRLNGKLFYSKKSLGVENSQIEYLKKHGVKKVLIKEGVPFVPSFLIGLLITLAYGSVLV